MDYCQYTPSALTIAKINAGLGLMGLGLSYCAPEMQIAQLDWKPKC